MATIHSRPRRKPKGITITPEALATLMARLEPKVPEGPLFKPPVVMPGAIPNDAKLAMDEACSSVYDYANLSFYDPNFGFMGYPALAALSQRPEYRKISSTFAKEMTRKWIKLVSTSDNDAEKAEKIKRLEAELKRFKIRALFRKAAELDGYFGRGQIYIDMGADPTDSAVMQSRLLIDKRTVTIGSIKRFTAIEPMWTYPADYNSSEPLKPDYFKPASWFVMGRKVHGSRLITFVGHEVPDILKPAYNFGGLSMSQMARPYVENWLRTRDSVGDLVHSFSVSGIRTDMGSTLAGGDGGDLFARAQLFNMLRDNRGLMLLDKEREEFFQFNTPLSGIDKLQAQAQEQLSSVSSIPLVKLLGITPSGLNASSDGEVRVFYDEVHARQEAMFADNLVKVLDLIQLNTFGEIDPDIEFQFVPLWQLDDAELATVRKSDADTDVELLDRGVISSQEVRKRLANDPNSGYHGLDVDDPDDDPLPDPALENDDAS